MANARLYPFWGSLTEALRTGQPQNEAKGGAADFFAALYADPDRLEGFLKAMTGLSLGSAHGHREQVPLGPSTRPSSTSARPRAACRCRSRWPTRTSPAAGSTCRPSARSSRSTSRSHGLGDRLRFHPGDFFDDPLPAADVLVMGHILHDWDLEEKRMLLAKAYDGAAGRRGADRLRGADRRRAPGERLRPADEPEHADRDARRASTTPGPTATAGCATPASARPASSTSSGPDSMVMGIK